MTESLCRDEYTRQKTAFHLMSLAASAESNKAFEKAIEPLGFRLLTKYSHGDLSKPRYCCTTVENIENPKEIFVLNRGLPWHKMNFLGALEELPSILAAAISKKPEGTDILQDKLCKIRQEREIESMTVIGHSRGALVVEHVADIPELMSSDNLSVLTISVESPGVNWLKIQNPDYIQYVSNFNSIINSCGSSGAKQTKAIKNIPEDITGRDFIGLSIESHGIESLLNNFHNQEDLQSKPASFSFAYRDFLRKGGKGSLQAALMVKTANIIKNKISAVEMLSSYVELVRPDSYAQDSIIQQDKVLELSGDVIEESS